LDQANEKQHFITEATHNSFTNRHKECWSVELQPGQLYNTLIIKYQFTVYTHYVHNKYTDTLE